MTDEDRAMLDAASEFLGVCAQASGNTFTVQADDDRTLRVCFPLATEALNQVAAALTLFGQGHQAAAGANARVALEHALLAQWVFYTAESEDRVVRTMRDDHGRLLGQLRDVHDLPEDLLRPAEQTEGPKAPGQPPMKVVADRFDTSGSLYFMYRHLSAWVHPSVGTLARHLELADDGKLVNLLGTPTAEDGDVPVALAMASGLAAFVLESLRTEPNEAPRILQISARTGVPVDLSTSDSQPLKQRHVALTATPAATGETEGAASTTNGVDDTGTPQDDPDGEPDQPLSARTS